MAATKIKLSCSSCQGEVVYDKETSKDDDAAHAKLHGASCAFKTSASKMSYVAEHGLPVEAEVLEKNEVLA